MTKLWLAAGVAALAIAAPAAADKGGKGGDHKGAQTAKVERGNGGKGPARTAKVERRGGAEKARNAGGERRQAKTTRAPQDREARAERAPERREVRSARKVEQARPVRVAREDRRVMVQDHNRDQRRLVQADRRGDRPKSYGDGRVGDFDRRDGQRLDRERLYRDRDGRGAFPLRFASRGYGWRDHDGCPPGLAKKRNGCLPPGQAKKLVGHAVPAAFATSLLPAYYRSWYPDNDDYYFRTGDDFIYRINRHNGLIDGYMPLFSYSDYAPDYYYVGEPYPLDYVSFYNVPVAYQSYYPDEGDWLYRYGDGAIYQVDPASGMVNAIVQLLAGDLAVGSPLPLGYDVYNVPYAYRDRYYDTPDHWYRYNDGYIYQVDPKTRLIQAVIQALV